MKITVDGKLAYLGDWDVVTYVYVGEHSQGDSPIPIKRTEKFRNLLIDYSEDDEVIGVEILKLLKKKGRK